LASEKCVVKPASSPLYIAVDGYFAKTGAAFTLSLTEQQLQGEGTSTVATKVGGAPLKFSGKVIGGGGSGIGDSYDSFYWVFVSPGQAYRVTLTDFKEDLDLYVREGNSSDPDNFTLGSAAISCPINTGEGVDEVCVANNNPGYKTLLIGVNGFKAAADVAHTFTVIVEESKPISGDDQIVDITDTLPIEVSSTVDGGDKTKGILYDPKSLDSFYSVDLPGGADYRIGIYKLSADANLYFFSDKFVTPISTKVCPYTLRGQDPKTGAYLSEYCDLTVKTPTTIYFAVDGAYTYGEGAKYLIVVEQL
jgi:hypothetical protein